MRVYIAGPYTNTDPVVNTRRAISAGEAVRGRGHTPFIPHLTLFWHLVYEHEAQFWYDYDLEWLAVCNALIRLPGDSLGADKEVDRAKELGIPVYTMREFFEQHGE